VFLVVSKSSMKRAFDLLGGNEKLFWFLEVSRKWYTLDTWLKDLVFPSALQGQWLLWITTVLWVE